MCVCGGVSSGAGGEDQQHTGTGQGGGRVGQQMLKGAEGCRHGGLGDVVRCMREARLADMHIKHKH